MILDPDEKISLMCEGKFIRIILGRIKNLYDIRR